MGKSKGKSVLSMAAIAGLMLAGCGGEQRLYLDAEDFVPSDQEIAVACKNEGGIVKSYSWEAHGETFYAYKSCAPPSSVPGSPGLQIPAPTDWGQFWGRGDTETTQQTGDSHEP